MLKCEECRTATSGAAHYWIALLVPADERDGESDVAIYCPRCAEIHFQFFSRHRSQRGRS